jgi:hypothetical protein
LLGFYGSGMSAPEVHASDYIDFLIVTPKAYSGTEAARVQPDDPDAPAHDAFTRLLTRLEPDPVRGHDPHRPRPRVRAASRRIRRVVQPSG